MTRFALIAALMGATTAVQAADITIGMQLEPPHLDPTSAAAGAIDQVVYANLFEGLTRFGPEGEVKPALATAWESSEDGKVWTFTLAEGVTFHDGSTFDAEDVVFSLDRARGEDSANAQKALFEGIESVEAVDPQTVKITLSAPNGNFPWNLAWGDAVIVAPESIETIQTAPVGTGPFKLADWVQGDSIALARNDAYWGEAPALDGATFKFISDPTAAFAAMMAEDIDAFPGFPAPENLVQFEADPRFTVLTGSTEGETIVAMNHRTEALANPQVREAIAHAVDRQAIIDGAMFGYGTPIGTHFAPHHPDYTDLTELSEHDVEKAKALLAEAGYAEGLTLRLMLPPPSYARRGGEIVAAQLREAGIETEITTVEWAQWLEQAFKGHDFDLTIISHTEPMDIGIYANPEYYFGYDNAAMQETMAALGTETDAGKRTELLQTAQRQIAEDYVNAYLFELPQLTVAKAGVEGLWTNAPTQAIDLTGVRWAE